MTPDIAGQVVSAVTAALAVYGGIRFDIKAMHQRLRDTEKSIKRAHKRIDKLKGE